MPRANRLSNVQIYFHETVLHSRHLDYSEIVYWQITESKT